MNQIKISEPRVLKALLNKTKTYELRKSYQYDIIYGENVQPMDVQIIPKPPKYKVGEVYDVVWTGTKEELFKVRETHLHTGAKDFDNWGYILKTNILGKVMILNVEEIKIGLTDNPILSSNVEEIPQFEVLDVENKEDNEEFAMRYCAYELDELRRMEGFNSIKEMYDWLLDYAPEIKERAMPFWLYSLEWLE